MLLCLFWWARQELNLRSSPCQGDVITPRPRAQNKPSTNITQMNDSLYSVLGHPTIFEIRPSQPSLLHSPDTLFLPLAIVDRTGSAITTDALHLIQNPISVSVMHLSPCPILSIRPI